MTDQSFKGSIDVVLISTLRPDLLNLTLASFQKHFLDQFTDIRIIINIDPVGESSSSQEELLKLVSTYSIDIIHRTPSKGNFSQAVRWAWSQVESPFFLHLEDDWFLKKKVLKGAILEQFGMDEKLAGIRLNLSRNPKKQPLYSDGISLNPSVFKTSIIKSLLGDFDIDKDPEKQFRNHRLLNDYNFLYYGKKNEGSFVIDTGKKWRKANSFSKWGADEKTITWNRKTKCSSFGILLYNLKYRFFISLWKIMLNFSS